MQEVRIILRCIDRIKQLKLLYALNQLEYYREREKNRYNFCKKRMSNFRKSENNLRFRYNRLYKFINHLNSREICQT